ncbi:MAG TPA: hypothetical protein VNE59_07260 [Burkholderiales bacterium]|nr:hypothetical protein [Burkholderiales bacterium]
MSHRNLQLKPTILAGAAAFALLAAPLAMHSVGVRAWSNAGIANAQDEGGGAKGKAQMGPSGEHGSRGAREPGAIGGGGQGQGGPSGDSDAKGPRYGGEGSKPTPGTQGGAPAWAKDTIGEVELGRMNVARAPAHVIDRALAEAITTLTDPANQTLYKLDSLDAIVQAILNASALRVDSPLQNLALYRELLTTATLGTTGIPVTTANYTLLAAIFIGGASDKTLPISASSVEAVNTIMGLTLPTGVTATDVAVAADTIRQAILTAHGE